MIIKGCGRYEKLAVAITKVIAKGVSRAFFTTDSDWLWCPFVYPSGIPVYLQISSYLHKLTLYQTDVILRLGTYFETMVELHPSTILILHDLKPFLHFLATKCHRIHQTELQCEPTSNRLVCHREKSNQSSWVSCFYAYLMVCAQQPDAILLILIFVFWAKRKDDAKSKSRIIRFSKILLTAAKPKLCISR